MRLRLTVQRHGLPPARVLWTIAAVRPPYSAAGPEPTVAQLLEQINEIIPLESEDWGLEDYAVEVGGFECLHFSETSQVLKEDDEVCIRPLSTLDLRCRRISGRDQISSDGRHLTDGVAFGRPLLRRPDRPAIRIPPRKRRRLTYDEDDEGDFEAYSQLVVRSGDGNNSSSVSGSDDSEDSVIASDDDDDDDDDEDLHAELNDIRHDLDAAIVEDEEAHIPNRLLAPAGPESQQLGALSTRRPRKAQGLGLVTSSLLVDEDGKPYPETYDNPLLDMFADDESVGRAASPEDMEPVEPGPAPRQHERHPPGDVTRTSSTGSGKSPGKNGKSVRSHESERDTRVTVRLESSDDSEDDDFEPSDSSIVEDESDKENITPGSQAGTDNDQAAELAAKTDSSFSSESDSDTDDTSSSGSSSSGSTSFDSEGEHALRTRVEHATKEQEASSSESSSSDSTSSSSEDEQPKPSSTSKQAVDRLTRKKKIANVPVDGHEKLQESREPKEPVPPGAGQRSTQMRNQRRKEYKSLLRLKKSGKLPSNATLADLPTREAARFESRRRNLLQAISSGGVDVQNDLALDQASAVEKSDAAVANIEKSTPSSCEKSLVDALSVGEPGVDVVTAATRDRMEDPIVPDVQSPREVSQSRAHTSSTLLVDEDITAAAKPRMRLDMNSSRRLLFGALGHRAPKTKEDEVKLQEKLKGDAQKPRKPPPQAVEDNNDLEADSLAPSDGNSRWQDKVELSAVECCYDGIELSTPPFPFVQRWDPQQQRGHGAGPMSFSQKSKKRKRNNRNYEASFEPFEDGAALDLGPPTPNVVEGQFDDNTNISNEGQVSIDRVTSDENLKAANDQLLRETEGTYGDIHDNSDPAKDLPHLPDDLSAYPELKEADCPAGTIIAFKQLDMSAATNWQPIKSEYRTAVVDNVLDDGTLSIKLALRDRSRGEQRYDPDTGERLYTKFEMPGYDDSDNNDGVLELAFVELIDPKLVLAPRKLPENINEPAAGALLNNNKGVEESEQQAKPDQRSPVLFNDTVQQVSKDIRDPQKDAEATEQVRKEIQDLIKDAGWRSSIHSNESIRQEDPDDSWANQDYEMDDGLEETRRDSEAPESTYIQVPSSPRFNGFSPSPPAERYEEAEDQVKYPHLRGASAESFDGAKDDPDQTMADTSSQADMEAMQAIREDFEKDLIRPAAPKDHVDHLHPSRGSRSPSITSQERNHVDTLPPADTYLHSNTIPDSQPRPSKSTTTFTSFQHNRNRKHSSNPASDNDDLPDLSTVFSSFNSQRASSSSINNNKEKIKPEHHSSSSDEAFMSTLPSHQKKKPTTNRKPNINNNKPPSSSAPARTSNAPAPSKPKPKHATASSVRFPKPNRYDATPRSSQDWIGTQVVDLTLSSDPIDFSMEMEENIAPWKVKDENGDSDGDGEVVDVDLDVDDSGGLPRGKGWVRKNKVMGGRKGAAGLGTAGDGGKGRVLA
ncbi:MAG: hypothetical protein LQ339_007456 [Xanthoria mediterranea]|nr:MAG: hypothetical protein LQ339_007456 [Xanthoria mediterranea]